MQTAERILSVLGQKSAKKPNFVFRRIYRHLFNRHLYHWIAQKMNCFVPSHEIDELIASIKLERYRPGYQKHDQLVQGVIDFLLHAIYDPLADQKVVFRHQSEALNAIQNIQRPSGWLIKVPIAALLTECPPMVQQNLIQTRVQDGRLFELIRRMRHTSASPTSWQEIALQLFDRWLMQQVLSDFTYIRMDTEVFLLVHSTRDQANKLCQEIDRFLVQVFALPGAAKSSRVLSFPCRDMKFRGINLRLSSSGNIEQYIAPGEIRHVLSVFRKHGKPVSVAERIYLPITDCIAMYQRERQRFVQTHQSASNFKQQLRAFTFVHYRSLLKTIARKQNRSVKQVRQAYDQYLRAYFDLA